MEEKKISYGKHITENGVIQVKHIIRISDLLRYVKGKLKSSKKSLNKEMM